MTNLIDNLGASLRGTISALFFALNTLLWCLPLYLILALKVLSPRRFGNFFSRGMIRIAETWIYLNSLGLELFHHIDWQVSGESDLRVDRSYLVCSNHQSWTDIVVLQKLLNRRIPFLRFFIKSELIFVPLLGLAWQALEFPRMKRYSKEYLEKHPEKRGEDLKTTKRICERLRGKPLSILNFLEGTRITPYKHQKQNSPFANLLRPKVGGLAFVLEAMGDQFHSLLDVTIQYPEGPVSLWGLLSGKLRAVKVDLHEVKIPDDLRAGDYLNDSVYRERMQAWVQGLWLRKDKILAPTPR